MTIRPGRDRRAGVKHYGESGWAGRVRITSSARSLGFAGVSLVRTTMTASRDGDVPESGLEAGQEAAVAPDGGAVVRAEDFHAEAVVGEAWVEGSVRNHRL